MDSIYRLMKEWQEQNDKPINIFNRQVKFYVSYDTWDDRFFVESCAGYIDFNLIYFSSREAAKLFLEQNESQLRELVGRMKTRYK